MVNYKLLISYNGSAYCGFQEQPNVTTVESELKKALKQVYLQDIKIVGAGRTDAGVHAIGQVINYKIDKQIPANKLLLAINSKLSNNLRVKSLTVVNENFHARKSAVSREYHYLFTNNDIPFYLEPIITRIRFKPNLDLFSEFSKIIIGKHDFGNFRKLGSFEKSTIKEVFNFDISIEELTDYFEKNVIIYRLKICASGFLYGMVRCITGAIFEVLRGKRKLAEFQNLILNNDKYKYTIASAKGLTLVKVNY